jgi:multidrug transporter EmrE-like cation transporter
MNVLILYKDNPMGLWILVLISIILSAVGVFLFKEEDGFKDWNFSLVSKIKVN